MKKLVLSFLLFIGFALSISAQEEDNSAILDSIENSLKYQTGKIDFPSGNASLNVPKGFKFLDAPQAQYVMRDLWGNPEDTSLLGVLVPENKGVLGNDSWLFTISYDGMGFVEDGDAKDMNYDDLLKDIQEDVKAGNADRKAAGFESVELLGWASKPYYDENQKVLHWAKEVKFEGDTSTTLNYDLRVLGRKGVFTLIGLEKGINIGLDPVICIALGTMTACFGGVIRDILCNDIPVIFRREIYATICIIGGILFFSLKELNLNQDVLYLITSVVMITIRLMAVKFKWYLPALEKK